MKAVKIFIAATFAVVTISALAFINIRHPKANDTGKGFAVVELFTSEGCSSCPSADKLIARVEKESSDKPIYILAFHVDYWDRLGWKDAFSSADYTARQKQYAQWLKLPQYYTPQAIVNGHTEFVGSEENTLRDAIKAGLETSAKTELTLTVKPAGDKAEVQYSTIKTKKSDALLIALIQKNATTKVERGENGGHTLSHVQIVSQLKTIPLKKAN